MKTDEILTIYKPKNPFPKVLKLSQKDIVTVTNRGKPVAAIQEIKDEDDLEDYLLDRSPNLGDDSPHPKRKKHRAHAGPKELGPNKD